jgi:ribosomal protein S4
MQRDFAQAVKEGIPKRTIPRWLELDIDAMKGRVANLPEESDTETAIDTRLIVEFYSR